VPTAPHLLDGNKLCPGAFYITNAYVSNVTVLEAALGTSLVVQSMN
jgi:hypothetical protein